MKKQMYEEEGAIVLFVSVPDCVSCRERIQTLMKEMNCWEKVEIGYPSDYGSKIWLCYNKDDKVTDFWECAKGAKEILEIYHYRVM